MHVRNLDGTSAWYPGLEANPSLGVCGQKGGDGSSAFTNVKMGMSWKDIRALYGITACPAMFEKNVLLDLGTPAANGGTAEIKKFLYSSDIIDLHELIHLVTFGGRMCHYNTALRDVLIGNPRSHY